MVKIVDGKQQRGFAVMNKDRQREIAARGGKASHGGGRKPSSPKGDAK